MCSGWLGGSSMERWWFYRVNNLSLRLSSSAKTDADDETLKNELALQYRDMQNKTHTTTQNTEPLKKKNSNKGLKKFFTK